MMTCNKSHNIFLLIIISAFLLPITSSQPYIAYASNVPTAVDNLSTSIDQLIEARDDSATGILPIEEDITRRKKIISNVLTLSLAEIESAREKLNTAQFNEDSDLEKIKETILNWLSEQEKWFRAIEERLSSEELNLNGIRNLAKEVKVYREGDYDKEMVNVLNFILTIETQRLTNIANDRWHRLSSDLRRIERAGRIQRNLFTTEMRNAQKMINGARALVDRAFSTSKSIYLTPDEEASEIITSKTDKQPTVRDLCEAAIVNLRSSYGEFAKISVAVRRLLRLP